MDCSSHFDSNQLKKLSKSGRDYIHEVVFNGSNTKGILEARDAFTEYSTGECFNAEIFYALLTKWFFPNICQNKQGSDFVNLMVIRENLVLLKGGGKAVDLDWSPERSKNWSFSQVVSSLDHRAQEYRCAKDLSNTLEGFITEDSAFGFDGPMFNIMNHIASNAFDRLDEFDRELFRQFNLLEFFKVKNDFERRLW